MTRMQMGRPCETLYVRSRIFANIVVLSASDDMHTRQYCQSVVQNFTVVAKIVPIKELELPF